MTSEYRGVKLIGDKPSKRISAIQVINTKGDLSLLSPVEYRNQSAEPHDFLTLPWEVDAEFRPAKPTPQSN
jgi:hypothetical protein